MRGSPSDDDDKVQYVPDAAQVGTWMQNEPVRYDLDDSLHCEDDQEQPFQILLPDQCQHLIVIRAH